MPIYVGNKRRRIPYTGSSGKKARVMRRRPRSMRKSLMGRTLTAMTEYDFKRSVYMPQVLNTGTNLTLDFAFALTLNSVVFNYRLGTGTPGTAAYAVPAHTEFTNLFDFYKIKSAKFTFIPRVNNVDVTTTVASYPTFPNIMLIRDFDDATVQNRDIMCQHNEMQLYTMDKSKTYSLIRPKYGFGVTSGGGGAQSLVNAGIGGNWLDVVYDNINWYGIKGVVSGSQNTCFDVLCDIIYSFKGAR